MTSNAGPPARRRSTSATCGCGSATGARRLIGRSPVTVGDEGVQDDDQAAPTRVDDAGPAQRLQLLGGVPQRLGSAGRRGLEHGREVLGRLDRGRLRGGPGHGQDGALDRVRHGRVGRLRGGGQRAADPLRHGLVGGRDEHLRGTAHQLAEDHPGVAAGPEQGAVGGRAQGAQEVTVVRTGLDLLQGRLHGQVEVGAGVAVRDRVDVEGVDLLPGPAERRQGLPAAGPHRVGVEVGDPLTVLRPPPAVPVAVPGSLIGAWLASGPADPVT